MKVTSGRVRNGRIDVEGEPLPEGASVMILSIEGDETFELSPDEEAALDAALAEASRGEFVDASEVLKEIRSR
ncbi:MAG: hypothetical protein ACT4O5_10505 [Gammaproteobacteria bacterium]